MRRALALLTTALVAVSCGGGTLNGSGPSSSNRPTASGGATAPGALGGTYGLLIVGGELRLIKPDASVFAGAPITLQGLDCSPQHDGVNLEPPVSATDDAVYFRDGGKIRMVTLPSGAVD